MLPHHNEIRVFAGDYRFLSNFWPAQVSLPDDNFSYPSVEHAYQAAKTTDPAMRAKIASSGSPGAAKRLGRTVVLRPGWNELRIDAMRWLLRQKFEDPKLAKRLIDTGTAKLEEGNTWGDTFWGVCRGEGENNLGKLLMDLREELRQQSLRKSKP